MPQPEQQLELTFPIAGMDITTEYELQPANTTPLGINVRSIEPGTQRNRGGSRCGIVKYVPTKLGTHSLIQGMGLVVYADVDLTLSEAEEDVWFDPDDGSGGDTDALGRKRKRPRRPGGIGGRSRRIRRPGGSGIRPRKIPNKPAAVDDSIGVYTGDPPVDCLILDNDTYSGVATVKLSRIKNIGGGTLVLSGPVGGWKVTFTPGAAGVYAAQYRLSAAGNRGNSYATINITVNDVTWPPPGYPATYHATARDIAIGDGYVDVQIIPGGALPDSVYHITANGPGSGEPGAIDIFIASFNELDGITVGSGLTITVTGLLDTGYAGNIVIS